MLYFLPANNDGRENCTGPVPFTAPVSGEMTERWVTPDTTEPNHAVYSARIKLQGIVIWERHSQEKKICHGALSKTMARIYRLCSDNKNGVVDLMS